MLTGVAVQHDVARVTVAQPENVAYHGHHGERTSIVGPALQPDLGVLALEPEHLVEVLTVCLVESVTEYLDFVGERAHLEVLAHAVHQLVFDVWDDVGRLTVLLD